MADLYKRHMVIMSPYNIFLPKHHLMFHIGHRASTSGNPVLAATFFDEALNKNLKQTLRNCHQSTFERMAFFKMREVLRRALRS